MFKISGFCLYRKLDLRFAPGVRHVRIVQSGDFNYIYNLKVPTLKFLVRIKKFSQKRK